MRQYVQKLLAISKYSQENEPGVTKYGVFTPRDETDTKTAWVIEEYVVPGRPVVLLAYGFIANLFLRQHVSDRLT